MRFLSSFFVKIVKYNKMSATVPIYSKEIDETVDRILDEDEKLRGMSSIDNDDHLYVDSTVPGQNYFIVSFAERSVTEDMRLETFDFVNFLLNTSTTELHEILGRTAPKSAADSESTVGEANALRDAQTVDGESPEEVREYLWGEEISLGESLRRGQKLTPKQNEKFNTAYESLLKAYKSFKKNNGQYLENQYKMRFGTNIRCDRAFKIRGSYKNMTKAKNRVEELKSEDNHFNIHIGEVGKFMPFNPNPLQAKEYNSNDKMLNEVIGEYKHQQNRAKRAFQLRKDLLVREGKKKAAEKKRQVKEGKEEFVPVKQELKKLETRVISEDEYNKLLESDTNKDLTSDAVSHAPGLEL